MRRKLFIGLLLILLLAVSGYLYLRYSVLKTKDYKPDMAKARSPLDLRPALIARLQQLVRNGSDSLYTISIDTLNPDIAGSALDVKGVVLHVDSAGYRRLSALRQLPDEVYRISFTSLHIDGIGIEDLIHAKDIRVTRIHCTQPRIEVWQKPQPYNAAERKTAGRLTLYQRLTKDLSSIVIGNISLEGASYTAHDVAHKDRVTAFKNIAVRLDDIVVDSATQYDANRVLFAKHAALECRDFSMITPDNLYQFRIGSLAVSGEHHSLTATNVSLGPRGGRQTFERSIRTQQELYTISLPRFTLSGADWRALMDGQRLMADTAKIDGGALDVYLDKSVPESSGLKVDNFPQQMLMDMPIPIAVNAVHVRNLDVAYEEYDPGAKQSGKVTFNKINGHGENISNMPAQVARQPVMTFAGSALFMNGADMSGAFSFALPKAKHGAFTADVKMGEVSHEQISPFAGVMGGVTFTSGKMDKGEAHLKGNNYKITGSIAAQYDHLHIDVVKKQQQDDAGDFKKRHVTSFIANAVLIKNANPGRFGALRQPTISLDRGQCSNFFNFSWLAIKSGLLKTIGIPQKLGM